MEWIGMLQKAVCYTEEHLLEDIHFEDVAKAVNVSPYEFHRAFSFITGMTFNTYVRNRRLSLAGQELAETGSKIVDIAMKYGFETQDGFTKAFTRFHGIAPKYAKSAGAQLVLFGALTLRVSFEGGTKIDYRIEKKEKQRFAASVRDFPVEIIHEDGNHAISDFWGECYACNQIQLLRSLQCAEQGRLYGLCAPLSGQETSFAYGVGVLLSSEPTDGEQVLLQENGCQYWDTEGCTYAVFQCAGKDGDCIGTAWERFYQEFLPCSGYQVLEETDYEVYFDENTAGLFCELWIPVMK
ncbi:MAG: helix-turn-helix domain-containing protein [Eubacterium sp.]|nr:helix-turn-helix domain-containing protein [Eubacterium sp.]